MCGLFVHKLFKTIDLLQSIGSRVDAAALPLPENDLSNSDFFELKISFDNILVMTSI